MRKRGRFSARSTGLALLPRGEPIVEEDEIREALRVLECWRNANAHNSESVLYPRDHLKRMLDALQHHHGWSIVGLPSQGELRWTVSYGPAAPAEPSFPRLWHWFRYLLPGRVQS